MLKLYFKFVVYKDMELMKGEYKMNETKVESKIRDGRMLFSVFFGASIGAVLGIVAYLKNWLG